jgi:hypothetical protein
MTLMPPLQMTVCSMPGRMSKMSPATTSSRLATVRDFFLPVITQGTGLQCDPILVTSTENTDVENGTAARDMNHLCRARLFNASPVLRSYVAECRVSSIGGR